MVLMLVPTTVFAEEPTGTLAVTINGFQVGNTPGDIKLSIASTIPGVTFSADDIQSIKWSKYEFAEPFYWWMDIKKNRSV